MVSPHLSGCLSASAFTDCYCRMNRRKADFKFAYKFLEDDV